MAARRQGRTTGRVPRRRPANPRAGKAGLRLGRTPGFFENGSGVNPRMHHALSAAPTSFPRRYRLAPSLHEIVLVQYSADKLSRSPACPKRGGRLRRRTAARRGTRSPSGAVGRRCVGRRRTLVRQFHRRFRRPPTARLAFRERLSLQAYPRPARRLRRSAGRRMPISPSAGTPKDCRWSGYASATRPTPRFGSALAIESLGLSSKFVREPNALLRSPTFETGEAT